MKKEEAIQKAIEKAQNECDLLYYPVVCEASVIDGAEEMSSALDNYQKKLAEHTDMWIICEMAKRWLEYLRDKKKSKQTTERTQWIPCSERLPNKSGRYIVTEKRFAIDDRKHIGRYQTVVEEVVFSSGKWDRANFFEVFAWMELPKPYREEESK